MSEVIYTKFSQLSNLLKEKKTIRERQSIKVDFVCSKCHKVSKSSLANLNRHNELLCSKCIRERTNLEKFGVKNAASSQASKEKAKKTKLKKYGSENFVNAEKTKATKLKRYGSCSFNNHEKAKHTKLEKYGDENYNNREKVKETCIEKYGVDHPSKCKEVMKKIKRTNLERYGVSCTLSSQDVKELSRQTKIKKYGTEFPMKNPEVKEKEKATNRKKYGCDNVFQNESIKEKSKETKKEKYGNENYNNMEKTKATKFEKYRDENFNNRDQSKATCLERYGVEHSSQNPEIHKKIFSNRKEKLGGYLSMSEKKFAEMLTNRKINFEYDFHYNGKSWDFKVGDILVEIDGEYNHGLLSDSDGKHVQGQLDYERPKLAEPYKLLIIDSKNIEKGIDELLSMIGIDYEQWIQDIKDSLPTEFPYPEYDEKRMKKDWKRLCEFDNYNKHQRLGMSIVNNFHKSIWTSHVGNKPSPVEAWSDPELLDKCVRNRFIYKSVLSSQNIAQGFNVCKIAPKVSVFNPSLARHLVDKYLSEFNEVFDPFSGFSGRMLGVCSLGKKYIGQDISETAIKESEEIRDFLNLDADLSYKDILNNSGNYDCLFTCSPYGLKEIWDDDIENKSCDEWIDECLKRFECKRYLFVVDSTEKYKDNVVETIENNSHFGKNKEYVVLIDKV